VKKPAPAHPNRRTQTFQDAIAPPDLAVGDGELVGDPEELVESIPPCGASVGIVVLALEAADMYSARV
jgi:hypothetical protein